MAEITGIEWADSTFNPWVGCTKVSPACDHCYAETWAKRMGKSALWRGERHRTSVSNWQQPVKWNREAAATGKRRRVFCASLADVFDNQVPAEWRNDLWELIAATRWLDWMLLTKRPQNILKMLPVMESSAPGYRPWNEKWPWRNVWLGVTVENQSEADRRIPALLNVPATVHFLSCEPLLEAVDLKGWLTAAWDGDIRQRKSAARITWVIAGGESGPEARPMNADWARHLRDQCERHATPFLFKQWGDWIDEGHVRYLPNGSGPGFGSYDHCQHDMEAESLRVGKKKAGRLLDGRTWDGCPSPTAA